MSCGSKRYNTILLIGTVPTSDVIALAECENVRVLHLLSHAGDPIMPENEKYKMISGDLSSRIFFMALFLQYDFSTILCESDLFSEALHTVCLEQWDGEFDKRSLFSFSDNQLEKVSFSDSTYPPSYNSQIVWTELLNMVK